MPRSPRSRPRTSGRTIARFSRPGGQPGEDLPAQLRAEGVDPKAIRLVVMTHMHFDHTSGMSEFPGATFVITEAEWVAATDRLAARSCAATGPPTSTTRSTTAR